MNDEWELLEATLASPGVAIEYSMGWRGEQQSHGVNVNQVDDGCSPDQTQLDSSESSHSLQARLSKEHL